MPGDYSSKDPYKKRYKIDDYRRQRKFWVFTKYVSYRNENDAIKKLLEFSKGVCDAINLVYYTGQIEMGRQGRVHLQGYTEWADKPRGKTVQNRLGDSAMHVEPLKYERSHARNYCRKVDTRMVHLEHDCGPFEFGLWVPAKKPAGRQKNLAETATRLILDGKSPDMIALTHPRVFLQYGRRLQDLHEARTRARFAGHDENEEE